MSSHLYPRLDESDITTTVRNVQSCASLHKVWKECTAGLYSSIGYRLTDKHGMARRRSLTWALLPAKVEFTTESVPFIN